MQNVKYLMPDSPGTAEYGGEKKMSPVLWKYLLQSQSGAASGREEGGVVSLGDVHGQDQPESLTVLDEEESAGGSGDTAGAPCAREW